MFSKNEILAYNKGYRINEKGDAYNINKPNKILKGSINSRNYKHIRIKNLEGNSKNSTLGIPFHRLQAYQKFGDKIYEENIVVRHLDNDSLNNSWDNIEIGTESENYSDRTEIQKNNFQKAGSKALTKYSDELVSEIKEYYKSGHTYKEIMEKFNISSKGTLSYIINNR